MGNGMTGNCCSAPLDEAQSESFLIPHGISEVSAQKPRNIDGNPPQIKYSQDDKLL
jgi:hypothetical protein